MNDWLKRFMQMAGSSNPAELYKAFPELRNDPERYKRAMLYRKERLEGSAPEFALNEKYADLFDKEVKPEAEQKAAAYSDPRIAIPKQEQKPAAAQYEDVAAELANRQQEKSKLTDKMGTGAGMMLAKKAKELDFETPLDKVGGDDESLKTQLSQLQGIQQPHIDEAGDAFIQSGTYKNYITEDGKVDNEKLLKHSQELATQQGGGRNLGEAVYNTLRTKIDQANPQMSAEGKQALQNAETGVFGNGYLTGKAFISGLAGGISDMGSGLVAQGTNNNFTDWLRGFKTLQDKMEVVKPELKGANLLKPETYLTRIGEQLGNSLPMVAVTAVTKNPYLGGMVGWKSEELQNMGQVYEKAKQEGFNEADAQAKAADFAQKNQMLLPAYMLEAAGIGEGMKGFKKALTSTAMELTGEEATEIPQQYFSNQQSKDYHKDFKTYLKEDAPQVAMETAIGVLGQGAAMSTVGQVTQALGKHVPQADGQLLTNLVQKHGVNAARAAVELQYLNGKLDDKQLKEKKQQIAQIAQNTKALGAAGISPEVQKLFLQASEDAKKYNAAAAEASDPVVRKTLEEKAREQEKFLKDAAAGKAPYAVVTTPSGATYVATEHEAVNLLHDDGFQKGVKEGVANMQVHGESEVLPEMLRIAKGEPKIYNKDNVKEIKGAEEGIPGAINKIFTTLKSVVPDLQVVVHENEASYSKALPENAVHKGTEGFFVDGNQIHINKEKATASTVLHEGIHPVLEAITQNQPEVIDQWHAELEGMKDVEGVSDVLEFSKQYEGVQAKKEAVVEFAARVADGKISLDPTVDENGKEDTTIIDKAKKFIEKVAKTLGIDYKFSEGISEKQGVKDLARKISKAVNEGRELKVEKPKDNTTETADPQFRRSEVQKSIDESTDTRVKDKVLVNELQALKVGYRKFNQGHKQGVKDAKAEVAGNAKQQEWLRGQVEGLVKRAVDTGVLKGDASGAAVASIIRKVNGAKNNTQLRVALDHVTKVLLDVEYDGKLQQATKTKKEIAKARKSKGFEKAANNAGVVNEFLKLNPDDVTDINEYNQIAGKIRDNFKGIKATVKEGRGEASNVNYEIGNNEIAEYTKTQGEHAVELQKQRLAEDYQDLVAQGVIDPKTMSLADMQEIIDATSEPENMDELIARKWAEKEEKIAAVRKVMQYQKDGLQDYADNNLGQGTLSAEQEKVLKSLLGLDLNTMSLKELVKYNDVINNILTNASFTGSGEMALLSDVRRDNAEILKQEKKFGIKLGSVKSAAVQALASVNLMYEVIAKSSKLAAEIQRLTGVSAIFNGHAKAKRAADTAVSDYTKLKEGMKDIDSPENRYRRGIYGRIVQHFGGTAEEQAEEFSRVKGLVEQTAARLQGSSIEAEKREGQLVQQVYNELLEGAASVSDVEARLSDDNKKLVDFWQKQYEGIKDRFKESSEIYNNKEFSAIEHGYTSTRMKGVDGMQPAAEEKNIFEKTFAAKKIDKSPAGTKLKRSTAPNLERGLALDLDFDTVQGDRFYESVYDVETGKALTKASMFFESPEARDILGNERNVHIMRKRIKESVDIQRFSQAKPDVGGAAVEKILTKVQMKGARIALGSLSQFLKQYPSVAFATVVNLGTDAPLFFKALTISNEHKLFEQFNIGERGSTKAGFNKEVDFEGMKKTKFGSSLQSTWSRIGDASSKLTDLIMTPLVKSDVSVARTSWLAYYMQDLKRQGVDINGIDWSRAHEQTNEEAAAYAEQMVSRTQNANDISSMPDLYQRRGGGGIIKNIFLPFSSFSTNMRAKMTNDLQKILHGGEKGEAALSLTASLAEQAAFNYVKVYAISTGVTYLYQTLAKAFGVWDDDDEEKAKAKDKIDITIAGHTVSTTDKAKKVFANTFSDFFFSGLGALPQEYLQKGLSAIYAAHATETYPDAKGKSGGPMVNNKPPLFWSPKLDETQTRINGFGLYGGTLQRFIDLYDNFEPSVMGTTDHYDKGGFTPETSKAAISDTEKRVMLITMVVDMAALAGVSDADLIRVNDKLRDHVKQQIQKEHGGQTFELTKKAPKTEGSGEPTRGAEKEIKRGNEGSVNRSGDARPQRGG
jgi:hypothetical protein